MLTVASLHALLATDASEVDKLVAGAIAWCLPFGKEAAMLRTDELLSRPQRQLLLCWLLYHHITTLNMLWHENCECWAAAAVMLYIKRTIASVNHADVICRIP